MSRSETISVRAEFAKYALLNVLGMLGISCYIIADTFFVARGVGEDALAALNIAIPAFNFMNGTGLMIGAGGSVRYSVCRGRGDYDEADRTFTVSIVLALLFAALFMIIGGFFSEPLAALLGATGAVLPMTDIYIKIILLFAPAFLLNSTMMGFVRSDGQPRLAMTAMLIGSGANILMDYIFIITLKLGIFGAVLATGVSPAISFLIMSRHYLSREKGFHFKKSSLPAFSAAGRIISLGVPSFIAEAATGIVITVFNLLILRLVGNEGVAAYGVVANLSLVTTGVLTGISQGMQPLAGEAHGRGDVRAKKQLLQLGIITSLAAAAVIYFCLFTFAEPIANVFNSEGSDSFTRIAAQGLRVYYSALFFVGFNIIAAAYLSAIERAAPAQIIALLRGFLLIIPAAFTLAELFGLVGVWSSYAAAEGITSVVALALLLIFGREKRAK